MNDNAAGQGPLERPVRPLLLTEREMLDIVDSLIRDRAYNRPAAIAIAMAVGAAVEAEVRERCAKLCDPSNADRPDDWTEYAKVRAECAALIRGPNLARRSELLMPREQIAALWNSLPIDLEAEAVVSFVRGVERWHGLGPNGLAQGRAGGESLGAGG